MPLFFSRNGSRERGRYASHGWNNFFCGPKQFSIGLQWSLLVCDPRCDRSSDRKSTGTFQSFCKTPLTYRWLIWFRSMLSSAFRVKRWISVNEQMRHDRTYTNTGPKQRLQHSNDLGTRRKQKKRKTKDQLEAHGWKRKKESRIGITGRSEIHSS